MSFQMGGELVLCHFRCELGAAIRETVGLGSARMCRGEDGWE